MSENAGLDYLFYLLAEMEGALPLGGFEWTATTAASVRDRLIAVTAEAAIIAERFDDAR